MATTQNCVYRSIKLQSGESYVLPADAELVMVDGSITSEANCAPTDNLEDVACYIIVLNADVEHGFADHPWEGGWGGTYISSINVGGVAYNVTVQTGDAGDFFMQDMVDFISNSANGLGMLLDPSYGKVDTGIGASATGAVTTLCFKTIPSIAETTYLTVQTGVPAIAGSSSTVRAYAIPYDDYTGEGKCGCSLT